MNIEVHYFGMIAEITKCSKELIVTDSEIIRDIKEKLINKYPTLENKEFRIAQNQELVFEEDLLTGQEIAILPPFAGG